MMMGSRFSFLVTVLVLCMATTCHAEVKVYKKDGDLIIGGLVSVEYYRQKSRTCSGIREPYSIRRSEAIRYAVERINNDSSLLQNLTLGYEMYDTCSSNAETLKAALKFIPPFRDRDDVIGVIGAERSSSSVQATNLLGLYNISCVSFLSTSDELSNSHRYPYFLRTVPPDKFQVSLMMDMLLKYNWTYVAFLYSDDTYGKNAEIAFSMKADANGICIGYSRSIPVTASDAVYNETVYDLLALKKDSLISVVILFVQIEMSQNFFKHSNMAGIKGDFIWIGSDAMGGGSLLPVSGHEEAALGVFEISFKSEPHPEFNAYFSASLTNTSNPWITKSYVEEPGQAYESIVIDAVEVLARGLEALRKEKCVGTMNKSTCMETLMENRRLLRDLLLDVEFESAVNGPVAFTEDGDSKGRYELIRFVQNGNKYSFKSIGNWIAINNESLSIEDVEWYLKKETNPDTYIDGIPKSVCSDPCTSLELTRRAPQACCWSCDTCADNEIIENNKCVSCFFSEIQIYKWPNENLTHCETVRTLSLSDEIGNVVLLLAAIFGIIIEIVVTYLYIKNREKKLIKSSSRKLCYIILVGIFLAYLAAISFTVPPSKFTCIMRRILPNVATSLIYVSLLTMTLRLYRIFRSGKISAKRPKFISPRTQVQITLLASLVPLIWGLIWIFVEPPVVGLVPPTEDRQYIERTCVVSSPHRAGQLVWDVVIVLSCCYFAFLARNLPSNFNQTRFIAFSVFCTLIVYIAFAPAFFTSQESSQQELYSALGNVIQPTVVLIIIFIVRIYAIYFVNEADQNLVNQTSRKSGSQNNTQTSTVSAHVIPVSPTLGNSNEVTNEVWTQTNDAEFNSERIYKSIKGHP